tara:strand:- start:762 stop:1880 length:1119 start_codon:yes stop_codon:yes gene_type:complete
MTNKSSENFAFPDTLWRRKVRTRILNWYRRNARDLPWRNNLHPYRSWVSEIMLQQTQVATVIDYFNRFIKRFPDVVSLANAEQQEVLRYWEGLGYYRRARQLHLAAQVVRDQHDGEFPTDFESVLALPGVGRYTAGAILSISRNQRLPIVEANTNRLFARLLLHDEDVMSSSSQKRFWAFAEWILPRKHISDFNQALMEVGALVCTPQKPDCKGCPLKSICPTELQQCWERIPKPKKKTKYENLFEVAVVLRDPKSKFVLIRQCEAGERWEGLWDFPRFECSVKKPKQPTRHELSRISSKLNQLTDCSATQLNWLTQIKHGVTKYRIALNCFQADVPRRKRKLKENLKWVHPDDLNNIPLSVTGRKLAKSIS